MKNLEDMPHHLLFLMGKSAGRLNRFIFEIEETPHWVFFNELLMLTSYMEQFKDSLTPEQQATLAKVGTYRAESREEDGHE